MKKHISTIIQIVIAALFIVSAIAKMYPSPYFAISTFEVKQLYPLGFSETAAAWFSRTLIGIEMALGLLILQKNYLKKLVIPATIILLIVFIIQLAYETFVSGNSGNCGCFGELIPMTPVEAIIKNIVAVGLLVWLYRLVSDKVPSKFWPIGLVIFASILGIFLLAPIKKTTEDMMVAPEMNVLKDSIVVDSSAMVIPTDTVQKVTSKDSVKKETVKTEVVKVEKIDGPKPVKSGYAKFFSDIDKEKKTLCFFVPGCDHCRTAAKELTELKAKDPNFPAIKIIFMNEEPEKIPDFFAETGAKYPYKIVEIIPFWTMLGTGKDTPGVKYLWNGNEYKYFYGINDNKFIPSEYQAIINKSFEELK